MAVTLAPRALAKRSPKCPRPLNEASSVRRNDWEKSFARRNGFCLPDSDDSYILGFFTSSVSSKRVVESNSSAPMSSRMSVNRKKQFFRNLADQETSFTSLKERCRDSHKRSSVSRINSFGNRNDEVSCEKGRQYNFSKKGNRRARR